MTIYGVELIINEAESCIVLVEAADGYCAEIWVRKYLPENYCKIGKVKRFEEMIK